MTLGEICNRNVVIATEQEPVIDAAKRMHEFHVGDLVVVKRKQEGPVPVGILTDRDIVVRGVAQALDRLSSLQVSHLMTPNPVTARDWEGVEAALSRMRTHGVRRLPVVNDAGALLGIVTFDDLIEMMSQEMTDLARLVAREQKREREQRV